MDLRCNLACPCPSRIKPLLAASASAVGMWATRLRCPSEAAYPQPSPPPRFCPCRRATPPSASDCHRLVRASKIVESHPGTDAGPRLAAIGIGFQMHLFILDGAPQPFDENVVHEAA